MELELGLDPDDAARLTRLALLAPLRNARPRTRSVRIVWHDSPDRALAQQGLALAEQRPLWRLERLHPNHEPWPPGSPPPALATGRSAAALGRDLPQVLAPVAAYEGRATTTSLNTEQGPLELTLLRGSVQAVAGDRPISLVRFAGPPAAVESLALALAGEACLAVPRASLAAQALSLASGLPPPARRDGAPVLPAGHALAPAFAYVTGHLTDVILHFAPLAAEARDGPEPVHQMRVAVRRLRSAIKVFRRAVGSPAVDAADAGLKLLAGKLAPTRDWDVFVTETLAAVAAIWPEDQRLQRLLAAAERRRRACHDELRAYLASVEFRRLGIELACLAGSEAWQSSHDETPPLEAFASQVLGKRLKRLAGIDDDLTALEPAAVHKIRLHAKRLRYAAEIFEPVYAGKAAHRFIRRLSRVQNALGKLNDATVAAHLLGELSNASHGFASGLVLGFIGAHGNGTRERIDKEWRKFHRLDPFWA